ncbi:MAG: hypothetical protein QOJ29_2351 [Thermoleophilaceae bacterium]|nr:hypothetical protein [Thermoleophilaceae bacterium]
MLSQPLFDKATAKRSNAKLVFRATVRLRYFDGTVVKVRTRCKVPRWLAVLDRGPGLGPGEEETVFARFHRGSASRLGVPGGDRETVAS